MAVDERRRSELYQAAASAFGEEPAQTMFELLPPQGVRLATQDDIAALHRRFDVLEARFTQRFDAVDQRFEALDQRFEAVDQRFDAVDQRFDAVDDRFEDHRRYLDARLDAVRDELLAAFRGELVTAVSGQTRAVIVAVATATFGIGGLAVTLAQLL